jgi:hypothetical protein
MFDGGFQILEIDIDKGVGRLRSNVALLGDGDEE